MNKDVLFVCTYGDFLTSFELSNISIYQKMGYRVHCACNFEDKDKNQKNEILLEKGCILHNISFVRTPCIQMITNLIQLENIIKRYNINVVDCHNAVCGVIARIAAKRAKIRKVVYTPHSFFFYKGCPLKNKIIYKPIEMLLAKYTDLLILINNEDYQIGLKMKLRGKAIYVPGIGINMEKILNAKSEATIRNEYNIPDENLLFVSIGELNANKNHESVIRALAMLNEKKFTYIICGMGDLKEYLISVIKECKLEKNVILAGYRTDVFLILKEADAFIFPSFREGLSASLMEAMTCGKYCICSKIKGNVDLINGENGMLFNPANVEEIYECINKFINNSKQYKQIGLSNTNEIEKYDINNVRDIMVKVYNEFLD
ncbi:MAG: glycosyltransferase [Lachnospiraceae bacterium]|nr:glycosyltransferase [Lachnospiraceae bacterium]